MKEYVLPLCLMLCIVASCHRDSSKPDVTITVNTNKVVSQMQGGFGASIHAIEDSIVVSSDKGNYRSWGGSVWGANPQLTDDASWNKVFEYCDWLGLDWCRVEVEHRMYKPERNVFDTTCHEMQVLYKWLDYCQDRDIDIFLTEMWPNVEWLAFDSFKGSDLGVLLSAPNDFQAWANGYAAILEYLIEDRGYTCIKWISIANEPMEHWSWWKAADGTPQNITPGLQAMNAEIQKRDLPVKLVAPDGNLLYDKNGVLNQNIIDCIAHAGAVSSHNYQTQFDWDEKASTNKMANLTLVLEEWKKLAVQSGNKPLFVGEFGSFLYGIERDTDGPTRYLSLLKDAQFVIRSSQVGIDAYNKWSLLNRGDLDGQWQLINTWDVNKHALLPTEEISPNKNGINMYGMFPRFTSKYAKVIETKTVGSADSTFTFQNVYGGTETLQHVFATCFQCPNTGNYSVFVTNDSQKSYTAQICFEGLQANLPLYVYEINEAQKDSSELLLQPLQTIALDGSDKCNVIINPMSVMCLSNFNLSLNAVGVR